MKLCFQADADLNQAIVTGVMRRIPEIDFQSANGAGLPLPARLPDFRCFIPRDLDVHDVINSLLEQDPYLWPKQPILVVNA